MPATLQERELDTKGTLSLSEAELVKFFDSQARKLVSLSGEAALKRICSGKAGSNLAWTELTLLATLLHCK